MSLIDLTHIIQEQTPVYPGDSEMELIQTNIWQLTVTVIISQLSICAQLRILMIQCI